MVVTQARLSDLAALLELVSEYQDSDEKIFPVEPVQNERYLSEILGNERLGIVFIGKTSSGQPVGFATVFLAPHTLHGEQIPEIRDLFVTSVLRRKGFGRQLFEHALRWARQQKYKRMIWFIENVNVVAQYLFDPYDTHNEGWVGYNLELD
jgi:GNAT superfamily N-acetyltransferase